MNKARRNELSRVMLLMEKAREILESVIDEEQEAFDNMPEGLKYSERGENMEEYIRTMEEVLENLDVDELLNIVEG